MLWLYETSRWRGFLYSLERLTSALLAKGGGWLLLLQHIVRSPIESANNDLLGNGLEHNRLNKKPLGNLTVSSLHISCQAELTDHALTRNGSTGSPNIRR